MRSFSSGSKKTLYGADTDFHMTGSDDLQVSERVFEHEFVKKIVNAILLPDSKAGEVYSPRIVRYLLEEGHLNATMGDGQLISSLRDQGDWVSVLPTLPAALSHVARKTLCLPYVPLSVSRRTK